MEVKSKKNFFRFLLKIYFILIICLSPILISICLFVPLSIFSIIGNFSIFLSVVLIIYGGKIFCWDIPSLIWKKSGFKKDFPIILNPTLLLISLISFFVFLNLVIEPRFPDAKYRAKQLGASSTLSSSVKAAQAYYGEYGKLADSTKDLGEYITITGCKTNDPRICSNSDPEYYSDKEITRWYSVSGNYEIEMKSDNDQNIFLATPTGKIKRKGLGVSGCFNSKNGKTKILEMDTKGTNVEIASCAD